MFITFEGCDGSGKSTQAEMLSRYLISKGKRVMLTCEPGGTELGERIRELILNTEMSPLVETYLFMAARFDHVYKNIFPFLQSGGIVICDRFLHSTIAYQSTLEMTANDIYELYCCGFKNKIPLLPNVVVFLAESPTVSLAKSAKTDRIERREIAFHQKVYSNYIQCIRKYADQTISIVPAKTPKETHSIIVEKLNLV
jgi:dTMP kinase